MFQNYKVSYTPANTGTTATNASGWEYVGVTKTTEEQSNLLSPSPTTGGITTSPADQTIKYWDAGADAYTFYAFADAGTNLTSGKMKVTKVNDNDPDHRYTNGYTITLSDGADASQLYFADRQYIVYSGNTDAQATNAYFGRVVFTFRNAMAKVRVGMYETIPGYSVTINGFEVAEDNADPAFGNMTTQKTDRFSANFINSATGKAGTLNVAYTGTIGDAGLMPTASETNTPSISFTAADAADNVLALGSNLKADTKLADADGTEAATAATAIFDQADKGYTPVIPQGDNQRTLKLKVDFTLRSKVGETIEVKGATAEVPAEYLQWKPSFAYTYLFKISDHMNGVIGSLTGLYPITLDAVAVSDGAGSEEFISTTSQGQVNIVTMGYDAATQEVTVGADDYHVGNTVYAAVYDTDAAATLSATNTKLYSVTTDDASNHPITAATVQTYLEAAASTSSLINQHVTAWEETGSFVSSVPGNKGATFSLSAMSWTAENRVYAVEYTYSGSDSKTDKKIYKIVKIDGNTGLTTGALTLGPTTTLTNIGGTLTPTLVVDGATVPNADVDYSLDYVGDAGQAVPSTVEVKDNKTANVSIVVPGNTTPTTSGLSYHVTATYRGRTYTAAFNVSQ